MPREFASRFPRGRPQPVPTWVLHPETGEMVRMRLAPKQADEYWEYTKDRQQAMLPPGDASPLRKWERRSLRDLRGQRLAYITDLDVLYDLEEQMTSDELYHFERPFDS